MPNKHGILEWWVMSYEWWVMSDEWWVTKIEWPKKKYPNSLLVSHLLSLSFHLSPFSLISSKPPWLDPPSPSQDGATHHSLTQVLKNFNKICFPPVELSSDESSIKDEILLNWHVDFGSTPDNYVILSSRTVLHPLTNTADFGYLLCL